MLRFANTPDAIFLVLLGEALDDMLEYLDMNKEDPEDLLDTVESTMPRSAKLFTPSQIIDQLNALKSALAQPQLYQPTDYHWLLLYESLTHYCDFLNDEPEVSHVYDQYGIEHVDCDEIVDHFFWDTDFLDHTIADLTTEQRQMLGVSPETFGLAAGMKPHPEELSMKLCQDGEKRDVDGKLSEVFVPGSKAYPSFPECPEETSLQ